MSFSILHPIKARIYNQSRLLEFLISDFSDMQSVWRRKMYAKFKQESKNIADGDVEIEQSIHDQMLNAFDSDREYDESFYNAMFILVFSYYEDLICTLYSEICPGMNINNIPRVSELCQKGNITLSAGAKEYVDFIFNKVRLLRNYITHNKWGRPNNPIEEVKIIKELSIKYQDITYDNSTLNLKGGTFLLEVLDKERYVLLELCEKLGFDKVNCSNIEIKNL